MKRILSRLAVILLAMVMVLTSAAPSLAVTDEPEVNDSDFMIESEDSQNAGGQADPVMYTVTFDDGTGNTQIFDVEEGASFKAPAAQARSGYKFISWKSGNVTCKAGESITVNSTMTFNAVWEALPHVHSYGGWTVTVQPTHFKAGKRVRKCSCGLTQTETLPKKTARKKWVNEGGRRYYFDKKGKPVKGWHKIKFYKGKSVKWCWFNKNGVFIKSVSKNTRRKWVKAGGYKFYFTKKKKPASKGFHTINGKLYYMDKNKAVKIGTFKASDGHTYTTAKDGSISGLAYLKHKYKTFVLIDISDQRLRFYRRGKLKLKADVVTGTSGVHDTPTGVFSVRSKQRNIWLSGSSWNSHVDYWMAFIGSSYGMHDATWRSSGQFSNHKTYKRNGSHGCVNMRHGDAADLYSMVRRGTTVIVQY